MSSKTPQDVVTLFDALVAARDGLDIYQIGKILDLNVHDPSGRGRAFTVIRSLRLRLGSVDDERLSGYSVPIRRESGRHVYFLSANVEQAADWQGGRADTVLSRLDVDIAHWKSMVKATDGRTVDGRIARACVKHFARLQEDLADVRAEVAS